MYNSSKINSLGSNNIKDSKTGEVLSSVSLRKAIPRRLKPVCEIIDNFQFDSANILLAQRSKIIKIAKVIIASQRYPRPVRSVIITGHTDKIGTGGYNIGLGKKRAEQVKKHLMQTMESMKPGSSRGIIFSVETKGESLPVSSNPAKNRRVEICYIPVPVSVPAPLPGTPSTPSSLIKCNAPLISPGATTSLPSNIADILRMVKSILAGLPPVLGQIVGATGVSAPTAARFLDAAEQAEAKKIYSSSLDFKKILITNGLGFSRRPFTVAVPRSIGGYVIIMIGDLCSWATRSRSSTLIHELAHAWQSQHHGSNPQAFMWNSVKSQIAAIADLPIAKAKAASIATADAIRRGIFNPVALRRIGATAFSAEDVSSYAYIPGNPFNSYAAEQIAQQAEDTYSGVGRPTPTIVSIISSAAQHARNIDNEISLTVTGFHRKSEPGVIFR